MTQTTIRIDETTADVLHDKKSRGDSYDDVITRLLGELGDLETAIEDTSFDAYKGGYEKALKDHGVVDDTEQIAESEHVVECHFYHWEGRTMPAKRELEGWNDD